MTPDGGSNDACSVCWIPAAATSEDRWRCRISDAVWLLINALELWSVCRHPFQQLRRDRIVALQVSRNH
uniref:Uncharacterized protein n=1 Tax=Anopheles minimus TaxID=112268 RepID=A0A182W3Y2_9DIPT